MSRHPWHATNHCNTTFLEFMQREWSPGKLAGEACAMPSYAYPLLAPSTLTLVAAMCNLQAVAIVYDLNCTCTANVSSVHAGEGKRPYTQK